MVPLHDGLEDALAYVAWAVPARPAAFRTSPLRAAQRACVPAAVGCGLVVRTIFRPHHVATWPEAMRTADASVEKLTIDTATGTAAFHGTLGILGSVNGLPFG
jgi:hypothetical protein